MNLVIDIGNTQIKTAVFKGNVLLEKFSFFKKHLFINLSKIIEKHPITHAILSSVDKIEETELLEIKKLFPILILNHTTKISFINKYTTPTTLGVDRIALIASAANQYPNKNVLIIDAGTCITYDFLNAQKEYFGGTISPGIEMRYNALHFYTANLPSLNLPKKIPLMGNSTKNAMHLGIINGVIHEIEGIINQFKVKNKKLTVILTGGDTIFLARNIKSTIFANPNFLLEGLNSILIYNLKE